MNRLTLTDAKQIDLVDYLASIGYQPQKIRGNDYWYLSPLREEKTASFKVDRRQNLWYDHGIGKGGSIIDFGLLYYDCTIPELLERLTAPFSFHRTPDRTIASPAGEEKKIRVLSAGPIHSPALTRYLEQRRIPVELAGQYCREVQYQLYGKQYYAIGFPNDRGGYELRNAWFKGSSAPKSPTFLDNGKKELAVFEGYFSFLSYRVLQTYQSLTDRNYLVLNSLSFFEKNRPLMEGYGQVHLYLDRDAAGRKVTERAIENDHRYRDGSGLYKDSKDLNQWLQQHFNRLQYEHLSRIRAAELEKKMNKPRLDHHPRRKGRHL